MTQILDPFGCVLWQSHLSDLLQCHSLYLSHGLYTVLPQGLSYFPSAKSNIIDFDSCEPFFDVANGHNCLCVGLVLRTCNFCESFVVTDPTRCLIAQFLVNSLSHVEGYLIGFVQFAVMD